MSCKPDIRKVFAAPASEHLIINLELPGQGSLVVSMITLNCQWSAVK